jgi:hypothetical protein
VDSYTKGNQRGQGGYIRVTFMGKLNSREYKIRHPAETNWARVDLRLQSHITFFIVALSSIVLGDSFFLFVAVEEAGSSSLLFTFSLATRVQQTLS